MRGSPEFYKAYNQWLYKTPLGIFISYSLSLEYPYFFTSVGVPVIGVFLPFILILSLTQNTAAIIALGVVFYVWCMVIWIYNIYLLLTVSFREISVRILDSTPLS